MKFDYRNAIIWVLPVLGFIPGVYGEILEMSENNVTTPNYELAANWSPAKQIPRTRHVWTLPLWIPGRNVFFCEKVIDGHPCYLCVDLDTDTVRNLAVDPGFMTLYAKAAKDSDDGRKPEISNPVAIPGIGVAFNLGKSRYSYTIDSGEFQRIGTAEPAGAGDATNLVSPNGNYCVKIKDYDLYLDFPGRIRPDRRITPDGETHYSISLSSVRWSPDSRCVAFLREDWREVEDIWLIDHYSNPRPELETFKWPVPGEAIEQYSLFVYDIEKKDLQQIDAEKWPDQTLDELHWSPDARELYFHRMSRDWKQLDFCAADPVTGRCRVLVEERGFRQIITRHPDHVLSSTGEILFWSMRSGRGHYYLIDPRASGACAGDVRCVSCREYDAY